jgi:hypothetical protein
MRCFELKLANLVARKISSRLNDFDFTPPSKEDLKRQADTIKTCVVSSGSDYTILGDNRFSVTLFPQSFSAALSNDFSQGIHRIKQLSETASIMSKSGSNIAWQIVTSYYVGFFSAIEILKAYGEFISYYNSSSLATIEQFASVNAGKLEAGTYLGTCN